MHVAEETFLLERTLKKIAALLHVGFGEAGSEIIAQNMRQGGRIDATLEGLRMEAAFGFCDIRQFTDATECLQEKVMVFVNAIAAIVHYATNKYAGAANKNIGDAFLLVWRVTEVDIGAWSTWCMNAPPPHTHTWLFAQAPAASHGHSLWSTGSLWEAGVGSRLEA